MQKDPWEEEIKQEKAKEKITLRKFKDRSKTYKLKWAIAIIVLFLLMLYTLFFYAGW